MGAQVTAERLSPKVLTGTVSHGPVLPCSAAAGKLLPVSGPCPRNRGGGEGVLAPTPQGGRVREVTQLV